jgi:putative transposase
MHKHDYSTEQFAAFLRNLRESFWGDLQGRTRGLLEELFRQDSEQQMEKYLGLKWCERPAAGEARRDYRNGSYERDYVLPMGTIRVQVSRTRKRSFLPRGIKALQRRSPEVAELLRQAFLRGISTRQVGRVVALVSGERVSAQTVSRRTRVLDQAVRAFREEALDDDWAYLILDGVWMKVRRAWGPQRVLLLVAYGIRANGERRLLAFARAKAESTAAWEGFLFSLYEKGLKGRCLRLVITDGCAGLAAALPVVYSQALHQRCWVHKMRNLLEAVRRRDHDEVKADAQKIYLADNLGDARQAFAHFKWKWQGIYAGPVHRLEQDLPELLSFYQLPKALWRKLRTTNAIEGCFVEVRRRTRPMVVFSNVKASTGSFTLSFKASMKIGETAPSGFLHKQLDVTLNT